jgi:ABC-type multidrug transport system ATPase subunit
VYSSGSQLLRTAKKHVAVAGTWLAIPPGQCLALLGPNGAGKTTTISCLAGLDSPSSGDALVAGHSVTSPGGVDRVREALGVCFQFDLLFPALTGREHLQLVAAIRGLAGAQASAQVAELLQQVSAPVGDGRGWQAALASTAWCLQRAPRPPRRSA